jgi:hypothetical protein
MLVAIANQVYDSARILSKTPDWRGGRETETRNLLKHGVLRPFDLCAAIHSREERLRPFAACPKRDWRKAVLDKGEVNHKRFFACVGPRAFGVKRRKRDRLTRIRQRATTRTIRAPIVLDMFAASALSRKLTLPSRRVTRSVPQSLSPRCWLLA